MPRAIPVVIVGAWVAAIVADATGHASALHHDALIEGSLPVQAVLALFLVSWLVMTAAMMLPSSLPMVRAFSIAAARQERPYAAMGAFLGGYVLVWTAFGAIALAGDLGLHRLVDRTPWLAAHPWVVAGGVLALAGGFQFSSLKDKCLSTCRTPLGFLVQRYRPGVDAAFRLGREHGLFCLGCCWALMLLMFAAGAANLAWMAGLAAVMVYEKVGRAGARVTPYVGVALLVWAAVVLAHPGWLPHALAGIA